jgi:PadR family transcriptional regulator, regulatory protein PadR
MVPRVRRKPGHLVPIELAICDAALELRSTGADAFHGYELAKTLRRVPGAPMVTAFGTLYRALARLEQMGLLESRWEDLPAPARPNRPRRRLYTLTSTGEAAAMAARRAAAVSSRKRARRLAPA